MLLTFRCSTSGEIRTHKQMLLRHSAIPIRVPRYLQVAYFLILNWQFKGKYYADATFVIPPGIEPFTISLQGSSASLGTCEPKILRDI